jgi:hypothetical protein
MIRSVYSYYNVGGPYMNTFGMGRKVNRVNDWETDQCGLIFLTLIENLFVNGYYSKYT